jgi:hypothetical protein
VSRFQTSRGSAGRLGLHSLGMRLSHLVSLPLLLLLNQCLFSGDDEPEKKVDVANDGGSSAGDGGSSAESGGAAAEAGGTSAGGQGEAMGSGGMIAAGGSEGEVPDPDCVVDLDCRPELLPSTGDFGQDCVDRINQFRVGCSCLPPLARWTEAEACAQANAVYDQGTGEAHSGWRGEACDEASGPLSVDMNGWATNECPGPYYETPTSVLGSCLAAMYGEGAVWAEDLGRAPTQADLENCDGSCYSTNGHFIAMTKEGHSLVACGITPSGEIWSVQNFK